MLKTQNKKVVDVYEWDKLVMETYNKPYSFQQQEGCQQRGTFHLSVPSEYAGDYENDSVPEIVNGHEMGVSLKAWLARDTKEWNGDKDDVRFVDMFWQRNFYPEINTLANDLYNKGLIEAGEYIIDIDW